MQKASALMYTIANIFNWVSLICALLGIVFSVLAIAGVGPELKDIPLIGVIGVGSLVYFIVMLLACIVIIWMVRKAKAKGTSKGWDVLFIVLGVLSDNIFYILGGIFGLIARK